MKNFMAKLGRLLDCWADIETQFITLFTIVMGAIIMVDVVFRNLGMQGISWVEEFGRFMLVARGAWPFLVAMVISTIILILFPALTTFLPNLVYGA